MEMIDYSKWVECVRDFSEALQHIPGEISVNVRIKPPINEEELREVTGKWPNGLPSVLKALWQNGSSHIDCNYSWTPPSEELPKLLEIFPYNNAIYGGVRFEPATEIFPGNSGIDPNDEEMAKLFAEKEFELWTRCAVFLHVGNGDCLGLDPEEGNDDPPVIYLFHDIDESRVISPSLSEFLIVWQELCYIGPESWLMYYWFNEKCGKLNVAEHKTEDLRKLLTPRPNAL